LVNQLKYDSYSLDLESGDLIMLATDGLYNYLDLNFINYFIKNNRHQDFALVAKEAVKKAIENKSTDNVSTIIIEYYEPINKSK